MLYDQRLSCKTEFFRRQKDKKVKNKEKEDGIHLVL